MEKSTVMDNYFKDALDMNSTTSSISCCILWWN